MVRVAFKKGTIRQCWDSMHWRLNGPSLELFKGDGSPASDGPFDVQEVEAVNGQSLQELREARKAKRAS